MGVCHPFKALDVLVRHLNIAHALILLCKLLDRLLAVGNGVRTVTALVFLCRQEFQDGVQLCNLPSDQLSRCFSMTLDALDRTLDFINDNDIKRPVRIDYINYVLGYFIFHPEDISDNVKDTLMEWIDTIDFTNKSNSDRRDIFTSLIA